MGTSFRGLIKKKDCWYNRVFARCIDPVLENCFRTCVKCEGETICGIWREVYSKVQGPGKAGVTVPMLKFCVRNCKGVRIACGTQISKGGITYEVKTIRPANPGWTCMYLRLCEDNC